MRSPLTPDRMIGEGKPPPGCDCEAVGTDRCVMNQNYDDLKGAVESVNETLNGEHGLMTNHIPHLQDEVRDIKGDMRWVKLLTIGILLAIASAALGVIVSDSYGVTP